MIVEATIVLAIISIIVMAISSDLLSRTVAEIVHSMGAPEYLVGTLLIPILGSLPILVILLFSNLLNISSIGISVLIGFGMASITLPTAYLLFRKKISTVFNRYRNSTFMWLSVVLFSFLALDGFISINDGLSLLGLFTLYIVYLTYRSKLSKEYVFLKTEPLNYLLFPLSLFLIIITGYSSILSLFYLSSSLVFSLAKFSAIILPIALLLPTIEIDTKAFFNKLFKKKIMSFENFLGVTVSTFTLIPGIMSIFFDLRVPIRFMFFPLIWLSVTALTSSIALRMKKKVGKKLGAWLVICYVIFAILVLGI